MNVPHRLMAGMMLATWFLSMWISNTATTAMMIPITEAILLQLKGTRRPESSEYSCKQFLIYLIDYNIIVLSTTSSYYSDFFKSSFTYCPQKNQRFMKKSKNPKKTTTLDFRACVKECLCASATPLILEV